MIDIIIEKLDIPKRTVVNSTIFKKLFYENGNLNKSEIKVFTDDIEKVIMLFSFTEDNINIQPYKDDDREYGEIAIVQVKINDKSKSGIIGDVVQRTIQYPTVIIFTIGNEIKVDGATKRINKVDTSKTTIEEKISTRWMDLDSLEKVEKDFIKSLRMKELSFLNFHRFYLDIFNRLFLLNISRYIDDYDSLLIKDIDKIREIQSKISKVENDIKESRKILKNEDSFRDKVSLNVKIKKLENKKNELIKDILK